MKPVGTFSLIKILETLARRLLAMASEPSNHRLFKQSDTLYREAQASMIIVVSHFVDRLTRVISETIFPVDYQGRCLIICQ